MSFRVRIDEIEKKMGKNSFSDFSFDRDNSPTWHSSGVIAVNFFLHLTETS